MKAIEEQSLYEILEVRIDAAPDEIARAYERARAIYAPNSLAVYTLVAPEEAAAFTRRIEEARSVLLDPEARARYDAGLAPGQPGPDVRPAPAPALPPVIPPARAEPPPAPAEAPASSAPAPAAAAEAAPPPSAPPPAAPVAAAATVAAAAPAIAPAATEPAAAPKPAAAPQPAATPAAPLAEAEREPPPAAHPARPAQAPAGFSVPEGVPWTGEVLRRVRESRGLTLLQIAERTKVARHHIENIEADRYATLPAPVYLRGILVSIAKELRLDGPKVARSYLEQANASAGTPSPPKPR